MTERTSNWLQQWLSPHVIISVIGFLALLGGGWVQLGGVVAQVATLNTEVASLKTALLVTAKDSAIETTKLQDEVRSANHRIDSLERFREAQTDYNAATMSTLAVLKKGN